MACFVAPTSVAVVTTLFRKKFPKRWHISWLNTMIWGGAAALAVEHVAHREIVPWPPFLTAMSSSSETMTMLHEMAVVGGTMTVVLFLAWFAMVIVYNSFPETMVSLQRRMAAHRIGLLALLLAGTALMVLVDRVIAFLGGEPLFTLTTDGFVRSVPLLYALMLVPLVGIWLVALCALPHSTG